MRRAAVVAAALAVALIVALMAIVASSSRSRAIASNYVRPTTFITVVEGRSRVCQPGQRVPAGTAAVGVRAGTYGRPGPPLDVTVTDGDREIASGSRRGGWAEGDVAIPIREIATERADAQVCVRNRGSRPVAVAGGPAPGSGAFLDGRPVPGGIRLTFFESGAVSGFAFFDEMSRRAGFLRDAVPGSAGLAVGLLLSLAAMGASLTLVLREGRR